MIARRGSGAAALLALAAVLGIWPGPGRAAEAARLVSTQRVWTGEKRSEFTNPSRTRSP